jgi:glutamate N-acetyltransferase/amino-acid N-acetyltransferase
MALQLLHAASAAMVVHGRERCRLDGMSTASWRLARGYRFAGVPCGVRPDSPPERLDLALVVSATPAAAAGVFTQNRVCAAPVQVCRERLPRPDAGGVVICSGNANACTGQRGLDDARRMSALAAERAGCRAEQMLVCSTGVIGRHLPMERIEAGIADAVGRLESSAAALERAAHAILTTDTHIKVSTRELSVAGAAVQVTGFAKGAAMIGPNMATMLAFVFTDAAVAPEDLAALARRAAGATFNCVSVEGHTSTNDTLLLFANGVGPRLGADDRVYFDAAVTEVCADLAQAIAGDAEGATHFVTIEVEGLRDDHEARQVAKTVAESPLVKTAIFGADPNWGRIVSAAGYAGVCFEERDLSLWVGDLLLYHQGTPQLFDAATASAYLKNHRDIHLRLRFTLGSGRCIFWTCDLGYEYVRLNADYTT